MEDFPVFHVKENNTFHCIKDDVGDSNLMVMDNLDTLSIKFKFIPNEIKCLVIVVFLLIAMVNFLAKRIEFKGFRGAKAWINKIEWTWVKLSQQLHSELFSGKFNRCNVDI